jgi:hypothetical protein
MAATAVGLGWYLAVQREVLMVHLTYALKGPETFGFLDLIGWISSCFWDCWPMAFAWTMACFLLRIRSPRPGLGRLTRQPGFVASCSIAVVAVCRVLPVLILEFTLDLGDPEQTLSPLDDLTFEWGTAGASGLSVAASWSALVLSGRWRPEASWLDRLGRLLGIYWVTMIAATFWTDVLGRYYG